MNAALSKLIPARLREWVAGREKLQRVIVNVGWLTFDKLMRMGIGLFVGVWVARYLGSSQYGALNYALALVWLLSPVATLGLDSIVIRSLLHMPEPENTNRTMGTAFALKLIGGLVIFVISIPTVWALRPDTTGRILVAIVAFGTIFQSLDVIDFWFQSHIRSKFIVYARTAAFLAITLFKIVLLKMHASLVAFAWSSAGETLLGAIGLLVCYRMQEQSIRQWRFSAAYARELLRESWPLILTGILITIFMRIDQVMLGQMASDSSVGLYSAAVKLAEVWYFIPLSISSSVFPVVVEAKKIGGELYQKRLQLLFSGMSALGYVIIIPTVLLSHWLIVLIYGPSFAAAAPSLAVTAWAFIFVCLGLATQGWMISEGLMKLSFKTATLGAVTNMALNFLLIPRYGATGAAFATLISQFVSVTLAALVFPESRPVFWLQIRGLLLFDLVTPANLNRLRGRRVAAGSPS